MNIKLDNMLMLGLFIFFGIAIFIGAIWIFTTEKRLKRFFLGKKAKDLEDTILEMQNEIMQINKVKKAMEEDIANINKKLKKSIRGVETVRFNPFGDQGSNQSFAISMLDEEGNGLVLSSLYSRERMSVFAKPIKSGKSEYELSNEEREALSKAEVK